MHKDWTLSEIADAPVLVVARVISLERESGAHFTGAPRRSAPAQVMTANLKILRFKQSADGLAPSPNLKIRFLGRDGPDFSFCAVTLPALEPGQVLLLPLSAHAKNDPNPWRLISETGYGMAARVAEHMGELALASGARLSVGPEFFEALPDDEISGWG